MVRWWVRNARSVGQAWCFTEDDDHVLGTVSFFVLSFLVLLRFTRKRHTACTTEPEYPVTTNERKRQARRVAMHGIRRSDPRKDCLSWFSNDFVLISACDARQPNNVLIRLPSSSLIHLEIRSSKDYKCIGK